MRDAFLIFVAIIAAIVIGGYLFMNGGPTFNPDRTPKEKAPEGFIVLDEGQSSGQIERRTNFKILTDEELIELWAMVHPTYAPAIPQVDFTKYEVIAVFDGTHASGGYSVQVTNVSDDNGIRTIAIERTAPGDNCIVSESFTSPYQIIRVPKSDLPIAKQETLSTTDCP